MLIRRSWPFSLPDFLSSQENVMKNLASLILVALFALINSHSASAQQGQLERSVIGVVVAQEQEDKETRKRSVMLEIRLDSPADSVDLELPNDLRNAAELPTIRSTVHKHANCVVCLLRQTHHLLRDREIRPLHIGRNVVWNNSKTGKIHEGFTSSVSPLTVARPR